MSPSSRDSHVSAARAHIAAADEWLADADVSAEHDAARWLAHANAAATTAIAHLLLAAVLDDDRWEIRR
jgi:hypothetical protein